MKQMLLPGTFWRDGWMLYKGYVCFGRALRARVCGAGVFSSLNDISLTREALAYIDEMILRFNYQCGGAV